MSKINMFKWMIGLFVQNYSFYAIQKVPNYERNNLGKFEIDMTTNLAKRQLFPVRNVYKI